MATVEQQVFVVAVFLCIFIKLGNCLHCFSCTSGPDDFCDDTFSFHSMNTVPVVNCQSSPFLDNLPGAGPNTHCGKAKKKHGADHIQDRDYIFRGCVPENYCKLVKSEVHECVVCDEYDRCNSSSVITPSYIFGIISLLLVKFNM